MITFQYNFLVKIILRYANILANLILIIYSYFSVIGFIIDWRFIIALLINIILLFFLNRFYIRIYRYFPFKLKANNEKIFCSDFMFSNKEISFKLDDIQEIKGGIFSGRPYMPLYIKCNDIKIGISPHIKNYNKLLTMILTNIRKELYENLLDKIINLSRKKIENKNRSQK